MLTEERDTIQMTLSALEKNLEVINQKIDNYYRFVLPKTDETIKK
ncbi:hypothetical protein [Enterococcus rivorum]|nr:hypothetical protein [Enterococcus rivorum]